MSKNLDLLVLNETAMPADGWLLPHSRLRMGQNYGVIGQIFDLSFMKKDAKPPRPDIPDSPHVATHPLPDAVQIHVLRDKGSEITRTDASGEEMRWAYAEDLATIEVPGPDDEEGYWPVHARNRAIKAFLEALPPETCIVLYRD